MKRRIIALVLSAVVSSFGLVGFAAPAQACAEPDPAIGCIGPCARPLQGSPTCPTDTGDPGNGNGGGKDKP